MLIKWEFQVLKPQTVLYRLWVICLKNKLELCRVGYITTLRNCRIVLCLVYLQTWQLRKLIEQPKIIAFSIALAESVREDQMSDSSRQLGQMELHRHGLPKFVEFL